MNIAMIIAGGIGSRMGADKPKQFINILNKPIIAYTTEIFQKHSQIDAIEVVCVKNYINELNNIIKKYNFTKVKWIVEGGSCPSETSLNGINYLKDKIKDDDMILIHSAVAPLVSDEIISDTINVAIDKGNSMSATPLNFLYGIKDGNDKAIKALNRDKIMQFNTPRCFKYGYLKWLYDEAKSKNLLEKYERTNDLMFALNQPIYFSKGSPINIKITTKDDLELFEAYIKYKKSN